MIMWKRIFYKKTIIITYFILNVYLENIDKMAQKIKKHSQSIYSRLATTKPNPNGTGTGQKWPVLYR
jgi:hypothetical protein